MYILMFSLSWYDYVVLVWMIFNQDEGAEEIKEAAATKPAEEEKET